MILALFIGALAIYQTLHPQSLNNALVMVIGMLSIITNWWAAGLLFRFRQDSTVTAPYVGLIFSGLSGVGVLASGVVSSVWHVHQVDGITGIVIATLLFARSTNMLGTALWRPRALRKHFS